MKTKKIIAALLAGTVACAATVSASAVDLTDVYPDNYPNNPTEVTANIVNPGTVNYTITIPATVDFGTLTQPDSDETDHYIFASLDVVATDLYIMSGTAVSVWLKDGDSTDGQFYISQKNAADPFTIAYDVYDTEVDGNTISGNSPINKGSLGTNGYQLCLFRSTQEGETVNVTLALNQNALYGQNLFDIGGDYSGTINFHSSLISVSG